MIITGNWVKAKTTRINLKIITFDTELISIDELHTGQANFVTQTIIVFDFAHVVCSILRRFQ